MGDGIGVVTYMFSTTELHSERRSSEFPILEFVGK